MVKKDEDDKKEMEKNSTALFLLQYASDQTAKRLIPMSPFSSTHSFFLFCWGRGGWLSPVTMRHSIHKQRGPKIQS